MTYPVEYTVVNGRRLGRNDVNIAFGAERMEGVKKISYKDSVERGEARPVGFRTARGRTSGDYKAEAECEVYREEWENFKASQGVVKGGGAKGYMDLKFPITIDITPTVGGVPGPSVTDVIKAVGIKERDGEVPDNQDPLFVKLVFEVDYNLENDMNPIDNMVR